MRCEASRNFRTKKGNIQKPILKILKQKIRKNILESCIAAKMI
jgi:hypothetical protein